MVDRAQAGLPTNEPLSHDDSRVTPAWSQWLETLYRTARKTAADLVTTNANLAATNVSLAATTTSLTDLKANEAIVGTYLYAANGTVPPKYLTAGGAVISRTTYAALFARIGTTYGAGDGSTTFQLPSPPAIASTFIFIRFVV